MQIKRKIQFSSRNSFMGRYLEWSLSVQVTRNEQFIL